MSNARGRWKILGLWSLLAASACSGNLLSVGDSNGAAGNAGVIQAGALGTSEGGKGNGSAGTLAAGGPGSTGAATAGMSARAEPSSAGSNAEAGAGGGGDQPDSNGLHCPNCTVLSDADVRAIANNEQKVFWVEYGTIDSAGQHRGDGRLLARDLDGGEPTVLATSLAGPEWVAVSSSYVYVFIDRRDLVNILMGVLRVPLNGGPAELVQELPNASSPETQVFASTPDYEYWNWNGSVFRIAQSDGATVETFSTRPTSSIFADDTRLYLNDFVSSDGVWAVPLAGGDETQLSSSRIRVLQLEGDYLYGIESPEHGTSGGIYLSRMPKAGGAWTHVASAQTDWSRLDFAGDYYFMDEPGSELVGTRYVDSLQLLRGSVSSPDSPRVLLASEAMPPSGHSGRMPPLPTGRWNCWQLTRVGILFSDFHGLYLTPALP